MLAKHSGACKTLFLQSTTRPQESAVTHSLSTNRRRSGPVFFVYGFIVMLGDGMPDGAVEGIVGMAGIEGIDDGIIDAMADAAGEGMADVDGIV